MMRHMQQQLKSVCGRLGQPWQKSVVFTIWLRDCYIFMGNLQTVASNSFWKASWNAFKKHPAMWRTGLWETLVNLIGCHVEPSSSRLFLSFLHYLHWEHVLLLCKSCGHTLQHVCRLLNRWTGHIWCMWLYVCRSASREMHAKNIWPWGHAWLERSQWWVALAKIGL